MTLSVDNVTNTVASDDNLLLTHGAAKNVFLDGCKWPLAFGAAGDVLSTDAAGVLAWEKREKLIATDTTFYISASGNDTTGAGSLASPWATVSKVLTYLTEYAIAKGVWVTIQLVDGQYTWSTPLVFSHPFGAQIRILGTTTSSLSMTSVQSSSGSSGDYSIVINISSSVSGVSVGDYVLISASSGGTNPQIIEGCHAVTAVDTGNNRLTITVKNAYASAPSGAVAATVVVVKTVVTCSDTAIEIDVGASLGGLDKIVFVGPGVATTTAYGLKAIKTANAINCNITSGLGFTGFYYGIYTENGGVILAEGVTVSYCYDGIASALGGFSLAKLSIVTGCTHSAAAAWSSGYVHVGRSKLYCNNWGAYAAGMAYVWHGGTGAAVFGNTLDYSPTINTQGNEYGFIDS